MIDNYSLWAAHDADEVERIEALPVCDYCGEPIQDESYHQIGGLNYCDRCLDTMKVYV